METALVTLACELRRVMDKGRWYLYEFSGFLRGIWYHPLTMIAFLLGNGGGQRIGLLSPARRQQKKDCSTLWHLVYGVCQEPMQFNSYRKLLGEVVRGVGLKCHQCADDTLSPWSPT